MWFEIDKQRHRESPLLDQSQTNVGKDATSQLVTKVCSVYTVYTLKYISISLELCYSASITTSHARPCIMLALKARYISIWDYTFLNGRHWWFCCYLNNLSLVYNIHIYIKTITGIWEREKTYCTNPVSRVQHMDLGFQTSSFSKSL